MHHLTCLRITFVSYLEICVCTWARENEKRRNIRKIWNDRGRWQHLKLWPYGALQICLLLLLLWSCNVLVSLHPISVNRATLLLLLILKRLLVSHSGNGVGHINKVKLRWARLVLGSVMTIGGFTIAVFIQTTQAHSAWFPLCGLDGCSEYWQWLWPPLVKKRWVMHGSVLCNQDCWHTVHVVKRCWLLIWGGYPANIGCARLFRSNPCRLKAP